MSAEQAVDIVAQVETDVGRHLVVARTAGMQAFARVADFGGEGFFDVEVDVFQIQRPAELSGVNFGENLGHAALDGGEVVMRR